MSEKDTAQSVIESYQRRRQRMPLLVGGLAVVIVVAGLIILAVWLTGDNAPPLAFLSTATPTPTETATPSPVPPTPTETPIPPTATETLPPTATITSTPSEPFIYVVQEGDNCTTIAEQFNVDVDAMLEINDLDATCTIFIGTELVIPPPGAQLDTPTPVPPEFRGNIEYRVRLGDTLDTIAIEFNSTVDAILDANEDIENANDILAGQTLIVPVNIATPVPTSTAGPTSAATPGSVMTLTPTS